MKPTGNPGGESDRQHFSPTPRGARFGKAFALIGPRMDARGAATHRRDLVASATGVVVEVGAGYGATFPFYPRAVQRVLALEPDATLHSIAGIAALDAPVTITVRQGVAEAIPAADSSVDTVVASLVLCSVDDQAVALAEIVRVLTPGGRLLFYEHVRSANPVLGRVEDALTPVWGSVAGGCHPNRDTLRALRNAGLIVTEQKRFGFSVLPGVPRVAHVRGVATKR
ncbi:MAG: class I SAM-dependent methyltransferase [Cryobacterium sp.]